MIAMKITDPRPASPSSATTASARKGLRTGVRAGLSTSDFCPRLHAPPVLQTSVQYPYE